MKKLRVSIIDQVTLKLDEAGEIGDIIDLLELQTVDTTSIVEAIKKSKDEVYNSYLKQELIKTDALKSAELNEINLNFQNKINQLQLNINEKEQLISSFDERLKNEKIILEEKMKNVFLDEKGKLENEISTLKKSIDDAKNIVRLETEKLKNQELSIKQNEINQLNSKINSLQETQKQTLDYELTKLKKEYEATIYQKEKEFLDQINSKELELTNIRLAKSNLQVKMLGEELERWCNSEYESYALSGFDDCKWYKDNVSIKDAPDAKATKADYIFEIYSDYQKRQNDKLISVCCEMKNESPDSKTKTKNSDHYKKLEQDRIKKNCQYSLLISELEWDSLNDSPIKKVAEYENMYVVRPAYFISFLSLLKSLTNKYKDLLTEHKTANENFKESQDILNEFEAFKSTYLDKPLSSLEKDVSDIRKHANTAYEASYKILGLADDIITKKISEIKIKIERFDIKKIAKKIDKLSNQ